MFLKSHFKSLFARKAAVGWLVLVVLGCAKNPESQPLLPSGFFKATDSSAEIEYPLVAIIQQGDEASVFHWQRSHGGYFGLGHQIRPYTGGSLFGATGTFIGEFSPSGDGIHTRLRTTRKGPVKKEYEMEKVTEEEFAEALSLEHSGRSGYYDHEEEACQLVFGKPCEDVF